MGDLPASFTKTSQTASDPQNAITRHAEVICQLVYGLSASSLRKQVCYGGAREIIYANYIVLSAEFCCTSTNGTQLVSGLQQLPESGFPR